MAGQLCAHMLSHASAGPLWFPSPRHQGCDWPPLLHRPTLVGHDPCPPGRCLGTAFKARPPKASAGNPTKSARTPVGQWRRGKQCSSIDNTSSVYPDILIRGRERERERKRDGENWFYLRDVTDTDGRRDTIAAAPWPRPRAGAVSTGAAVGGRQGCGHQVDEGHDTQDGSHNREGSSPKCPQCQGGERVPQTKGLSP